VARGRDGGCGKRRADARATIAEQRRRFCLVQDHVVIDAIDVIECKSTSQLASYDARSLSLVS
jgi:hypothetical protein